MHPKLKMLKEVLRQMQCAMAKGHGDDEGAGEEAMEALADAGDEKKVAEGEEKDEMARVAAGAGDGFTDDDLSAEKKQYMKHGRKQEPPKKGSALVMMKMAAAKKPDGKKLKHG